MKKEIEIKKKFLLRKLPNIKYDDIINITQYYIKVNDIWERYRESIHSDSTVKYHKTIKTFIKIGEQEEDEIEISESNYNDIVSECNSGNHEARVIRKKRHVYELSDVLKWEIDRFEMDIVIAEIEVPRMSYIIERPDWLENEIVIEITKYKEFSSKSLATRL